MSNDILVAIKNVQAAAIAAPELEKLKKAANDFESIFLKKLFSQMRSSVKETQFGQGYGKEIYNDMFDEALANAASKSHALGMGEMLYKQFAPRLIDMAKQQMERASKSARHIELIQKETAGQDVPANSKTEIHEQAAHATKQ